MTPVIVVVVQPYKVWLVTPAIVVVVQSYKVWMVTPAIVVVVQPYKVRLVTTVIVIVLQGVAYNAPVVHGVVQYLTSPRAVTNGPGPDVTTTSIAAGRA